MTNELDRAIDTAAHELIAREPSRTLGYNVMARVREGAAPAPRGAWLKAACVCAAALVVAYLAINRPASEIPPARTPQVARTEPAPVPPPRVEPAEEVRVENRPRPRPRTRAVASGAPVVLPPAKVDVAPIKPITVEPIAVVAIDVPRLEAEPPASIEVLTVEALTIEPLRASND